MTGSNIDNTRIYTCSICPTCLKRSPVIQQLLLGDGVCQADAFFNMACCFDAGDCSETGVNGRCNTCQHPNANWIGDGYCDKYLYQEGAGCCWDLDDCRLCEPTVSDRILLNEYTEDMSLSREVSLCKLIDTVDAIDNNNADNCPTCPWLNATCSQLGDGLCHVEFMSIQSCFDLGDCSWCQTCPDNDNNLRLGMTIVIITSMYLGLYYVSFLQSRRWSLRYCNADRGLLFRHGRLRSQV